MTTETTSVEVGLQRAPGVRLRKQMETRQKLLTCALQLFGERGFTNTTVEDITSAAELAKGTFFNYFPSKEHVLMAAADIQLGKYAAARAAIEQPKANAHDVLRALYFELPKLPLSSPGLLRALLSMFLSTDELRTRITEGFAKGRAVLCDIIRFGQSAGDIRRDCKPEQLAYAFQQSLIGNAFMWTFHLEGDPQELLKTGFDLYWAGISASAPPFRRRK